MRKFLLFSLPLLFLTSCYGYDPLYPKSTYGAVGCGNSQNPSKKSVTHCGSNEVELGVQYGAMVFSKENKMPVPDQEEMIQETIHLSLESKMDGHDVLTGTWTKEVEHNGVRLTYTVNVLKFFSVNPQYFISGTITPPKEEIYLASGGAGTENLEELDTFFLATPVTGPTTNYYLAGVFIGKPGEEFRETLPFVFSH